MSKTKRYCYGYLPETDFVASETTGTLPDGRVSRTRQQAPTFVGQQKINERAIFHAISRVPIHIFLWPLGNVLTWKRKESCCSPDVLRVYADIVSCLSALWEPVGAFARRPADSTLGRQNFVHACVKQRDCQADVPCRAALCLLDLLWRERDDVPLQLQRAVRTATDCKLPEASCPPDRQATNTLADTLNSPCEKLFFFFFLLTLNYKLGTCVHVFTHWVQTGGVW